MLSNFKLSMPLWSEALETTVYLSNQVPYKAIPKTPFELRKNSKQILRDIRVWGSRQKVEFIVQGS